MKRASRKDYGAMNWMGSFVKQLSPMLQPFYKRKPIGGGFIVRIDHCNETVRLTRVYHVDRIFV